MAERDIVTHLLRIWIITLLVSHSTLTIKCLTSKEYDQQKVRLPRWQNHVGRNTNNQMSNEWKTWSTDCWTLEVVESHWRKLNFYSASHDNWCTATLWNRIMTAQCEGMGEVGSARYEPALLPPCPSIRVLSYSNCQRSTHSSRRAWQFKC